MLGENLTIGIIIGAALVDSINPCVFGVLIFLIAFMNRVFKNRKMMLLGGLLYSLVVYITYLLLGFGILKIAVSIGFASLFYAVAAMIAIAAGLFEIKDYFWYGRGFSLVIPESLTHQMHKISKITTIFGAVVASLIMVSGQLFCTGASYLAIITIISANFNWTGLLMMVTYNLVYVLPLVIILLLVSSGTKLHFVKSWKQESRGMMRLIIGLLLVSLGWLLILISGGAIRL